MCVYLHRHIDGLVQERRSFIANTLELCLFLTNPLIYTILNGFTIESVLKVVFIL